MTRAAARRAPVVDRDVAIHARDGARLGTDVHRPAGDAAHPTLVLRTPYGRAGMAERYPIGWLVEQGYAVVVQDVRGTGEADGSFDRTFADGDDGHDCVEWAAGQPWSTGRVGMFGASAMAGTQWATAQTRPPHLVAIAPEVVATAGRPRTAFPLSVQLPFALAMSRQELEVRRSAWDPAAYDERRRGLDDAIADPSAVLGRLPVADQPLLDGLAPWFTATLDDPAAFNLGPIDFAAITVPAFVVGGWYDFTLSGALAQYAGMRSRAGSGAARAGSRLLVGSWFHGAAPDPLPAGWVPVTSGADARTDTTYPAWLAWMRPYLDGATPDTGGPRARVHTRNSGWQDLPDWPPPGARTVAWHLHAGGVLSPDAPAADRAPDTFAYDPADPVRVPGDGAGGVIDQRPVAGRHDVLTYVSTPLVEPVEATGPAALILHAATSAPDTDWAVTLVDQRPDGVLENLARTVLRARFHAGLQPQPVEPGRVVEYRLDLESISHVFPAGHRIGVLVTSSAFPEFDRNTNTGAPVARDAHPQVAHQQVHYGAAWPSRLTLTVPATPGA